jgi:nucleoside-diphosphate-sugar epimerase
LSTDTILITGADGYVGSLLAARLLARGKRLLLLVRAADGVTWRKKQAALAARLGEEKGRYTVRPCDLTSADAFDGIDPTAIGSIIHAGAITRFNVERDAAFETNVQGTKALLRFAESVPSLESIELLSTIYASGLQPGRLDEHPFGGSEGFANHYEWSKHQAEMLVLQNGRHLPWRIHRLATIVAHDESGVVVQRNAFHHTLRVYRHGLLSVAPGVPETPLYFVTARFAADAVLAAMVRGSLHTIYHVSHGGEEAVTLGELIGIAFARFEQDAAFRRKRILRPLFVDIESFRSLCGAVSGLGGALVRQSVEGILPFAPQLCIAKEVSNCNLIAALADTRIPDASLLVANVCSHLSAPETFREAPRAA